MRRHHLRFFEAPAVQEVNRNPCGAEGVAPNRRLNSRLLGPPLNHVKGIRAGQGFLQAIKQEGTLMKARVGLGNRFMNHSGSQSQARESPCTMAQAIYVLQEVALWLRTWR